MSDMYLNHTTLMALRHTDQIGMWEQLQEIARETITRGGKVVLQEEPVNAPPVVLATYTTEAEVDRLFGGLSRASLALILNEAFHDLGSVTTVSVASIVRLRTPDSNGCNWDVTHLTNRDVSLRKTNAVLEVISRFKITHPRIV